MNQINPSLTIESLTRRYGTHTVLDRVDLVREAPGLIGISGPNGSGKTTLLRIIAQLTEADSGTLEICGEEVERADNVAARALVGWVPHAPLAWADQSVKRNLEYALRLGGHARKEARSKATQLIERWNLARVCDQPVGRLSRGWQQRYGLARADLNTPPILLLDEPTTGLDTAGREYLDQAISAWRETRIILTTSHEHDWLSSHADQTLELSSTPVGSG